MRIANYLIIIKELYEFRRKDHTDCMEFLSGPITPLLALFCIFLFFLDFLSLILPYKEGKQNLERQKNLRP